MGNFFSTKSFSSGIISIILANLIIILINVSAIPGKPVINTQETKDKLLFLREVTMVKAFIFDMDGVIIDSEPLHFQSDKMVMRDFGIDISDDELNNFVGMTNPKMWAIIKIRYDLKVSIDELLQLQHKYKKQLFVQDQVKAIDGILDLISDLKENNIKIGLASSSSREFIEMVLKNLNIYDYFDTVISGEEVTNSKPSPEIFLKAAEALKAEPSECVVLEDSGHGVCAAKAAGMKCIAFKNPNSGIQDLSIADCIVCTIEKLEYMGI